LLAALRHRDFRLLFGGMFVSVAGTQMQRVAIAYQLYQLTGSATAMGFLGLARAAPILLLTIGGGVIADVFDRRRLMMLTQGLLGLTSLALALTTIYGHVSPIVIYSVAVCAGIASAFDLPARQALVPLLVPRADLANALSLNGVVFQLGTVVGPAIGGFVIAKSSVVPIYVFDACSFLAVIAALAAMKVRPGPIEGGKISFAALKEGLAFLIATPLIWSTMILDFFATFFAGSMLLLPILADRVLHVGPELLGLLFAAQPLGAAIAAIVLSLRGTIGAQGKTLLIAVTIYGLAIVGVGLSTNAILAMVFLAISGAADMISTVIRQTLRQLLTPNALRGRVTAATGMFFISGPQLGELEAGFVADLTSVSTSIASGGVACLLVVALIAIKVPTLRTFRKAEAVEA
jgi:MFS family permease